MKHQKGQTAPEGCRRGSFGRVLASTFYSLITVAVIAVVLSHWFPVLRLRGDGMEPTLVQGGFAVAMRDSEWQEGDVIAFYYNDKILVKRVIAGSEDIVGIQPDGTVMVNGEMLTERYVVEKSLGDCDIEFPYAVPSGRWFVMGDNRVTSLDSRNSVIGCIAEEQIIGRVLFYTGPLERFELFAEK